MPGEEDRPDEKTAVPEVAGQGALFVDPDRPQDVPSMVRELIADPARRAEMVAAGSVNAARFTWATSASRLGDVLVAVVRAFNNAAVPAYRNRVNARADLEELLAAHPELRRFLAAEAIRAALDASTYVGDAAVRARAFARTLRATLADSSKPV